MMIHLQFAHCPRELIEQTFVTVFGPQLCHLRGRAVKKSFLTEEVGEEVPKTMEWAPPSAQAMVSLGPGSGIPGLLAGPGLRQNGSQLRVSSQPPQRKKRGEV